MTQILRNLLWVEELLPPEIIRKSMHGGYGYYLDEKLVLILVESSQTYEHKGISYPFKIWQGCLFPIVRIKQNTVFAKFSFLENHPASPNWLYLPADSENFDDHAKLLIKEIKKQNPLLGISLKITKNSESILQNEVVDTSTPSLFSDAPKVLAENRKKSGAPPRATKKVNANKKSGNELLMTVLKRRSR